MDRELAQRAFIAGDEYTIADMSLFAYVHRADEAGFALTDHRALVRWIARVKRQDGFLDRIYPYSIDPHSTADLP